MKLLKTLKMAHNLQCKTSATKRWLTPAKAVWRAHNGQALAELAVLGAVFLMLLGVLVNYGLRYNFQQRTMQEGFRKALAQVGAGGTAVSNDPNSANTSLIRDKHIPDPSNTFGVGTVNPISGSGSVTRSNQLHFTPDTVGELPRIWIDIAGTTCPPGRSRSPDNSPPCYYLTSGFRFESGVDQNASKDKYEEIYGTTNVCWNDKPCWSSFNGGVSPPGTNVGIIDPAAGELIDYSATVKQCRQIVDTQACVKECERGRAPSGKPSDFMMFQPVCEQYDTNRNCIKWQDPVVGQEDCGKTCSQPMAVPWYCQNFVRAQSPAGNLYAYSYAFPVLDALFANASAGRNKTMGLQPDYLQIEHNNNQLARQETDQGLSTTDTLDWQTQFSRNVLYLPYQSTAATAVTTDQYDSTVSQNTQASEATQY